jgi:salicylate biosynthesis isochorismate synthase
MAHVADVSAGERRWLGSDGVSRLAARVAEGLVRARSRRRPTIVSTTFVLDGDFDPTAIVCASRAGDEPWFCFEQPDRDRIALAALGAARTLDATDRDRFAELSGRWRQLSEAAIVDQLAADDPPGAGLVAVGGFAFAPDGASGPAWRGFGASSLVVPELSLARRHRSTRLTINVEVAPEDSDDELLASVRARVASLDERSLPLSDPAPVGHYDVVSAMPPAHYEQAVERAVQRIRDGEFEKVVLAREVEVHAPVAHDPAAVIGLLREAFPTSFVYAVGRGDATFIGATPELLVRREGQRATTVALAGSTRRSADPAVDDHLAEQLLHSDKDRHENLIVARRIALALRPHSVWVTAADEPVVVKIANIQHLAAPIRAQLASPLDVVTLAGVLHPTPAVGAEPLSAVAAIPGLEGFDRGWYAGTVGWTDVTGDGEFCVALRCALVRGQIGRCFAGCGIVGDSDPAAELAESEIKLQVMLPALAG